jgi:hypothetical protein
MFFNMSPKAGINRQERFFLRNFLFSLTKLHRQQRSALVGQKANCIKPVFIVADCEDE